MAVVAELAVVVVFDDQPARCLRPLDRDHPSPRGQWRADRELVGGREQRGVGRGELLDGGAVVVDVDRREPEAARARGLGGGGLDVALDRERSRAARAERLTQEPEPLREARAHDHAVGGRPDPTGARDVLGERGSQLRLPARIAVAERLERSAF